MQLIPIDPHDIPNTRDTHRGRISYPLLKMFLEANIPMAKLDRTGMQNSMVALRSSLTAYVRSHDLPVYLFQRGGDLYLSRLDLKVENDGTVTKIENWHAQDSTVLAAAPIPIDATEVAKRFAQEKNKTDK